VAFMISASVTPPSRSIRAITLALAVPSRGASFSPAALDWPPFVRAFGLATFAGVWPRGAPFFLLVTLLEGAFCGATFAPGSARRRCLPWNGSVAILAYLMLVGC
jgi:hypothetical protein